MTTIIEIKKEYVKEITTALRIINTTATRLLEHYRNRQTDVISKEDKDLIKIMMDELDKVSLKLFSYDAEVKEYGFLGEGIFTDIEKGIIALNATWHTLPKIKLNLTKINEMKKVVDKIRKTVIVSLLRSGKYSWR